MWRTRNVGVDRKTGETKWSATPVDLIFGSNPELRGDRSLRSADGEQRFVEDFAKAGSERR
jgi:catalase-peroxidase